MDRLTAPEIQNYCRLLHAKSSENYTNFVVYDDKTNLLLDRLFDHLRLLVPSGEGADVWELWLHAPRGPIEKFGDYQEWLDEGEVSGFEEFQKLWYSDCPDEEHWFFLTAVERREDGYRGISLDYKLVMEQRDLSQLPQERYPLDVHEFAEWLLQAVDACIEEIRQGSYHIRLEADLPIRCRRGTVRLKEWWAVFPKDKEDFFKDISQEEATLFVSCMRAPGGQSPAAPPMRELCANDFFLACSLGYAANHYFGTEKTPREQYVLHADDRDDGLGDIDPDSPDAFLAWFNDRTRYGGHPWEVVRGGNSTHISLYPQYHETGFTFLLVGSASGRTVETVKFYLALRKAGLPVCVKDGPLLADRLTGDERIGIVPEGVFPAYCEHLFPNEEIVSFIDPSREDREKIAPYCAWQPIPRVRLREQEG